jgi:hypothetical protein
MDDQHVFAFVEAVHRTHLHAIHEFALNAAFVDDVGHSKLRAEISSAA